MPAISKRMKASAKKRPAEALPLAEAVAALKQFSPAKFDQTVDIVLRLGVDAAQADQIVRGSIVLPHGIGKSLRVVVFAKGDLAEQAKAAGADEIGADDEGLGQAVRAGLHGVAQVQPPLAAVAQQLLEARRVLGR